MQCCGSSAPAYTQSYNRYSYCFNNPLKYTDPTGWESKDPDPQYYNPGFSPEAWDLIQACWNNRQGSHDSWVFHSDGSVDRSTDGGDWQHYSEEDFSEFMLNDQIGMYESAGYSVVASMSDGFQKVVYLEGNGLQPFGIGYTKGSFTAVGSRGGTPSGQGGNSPYMSSHGEQTYTLNQFVTANQGMGYVDIITQRPKNDGLPGGPSMRYVTNPNDGRVMDMRHVMVVGYGGGNVIGLGVEVAQWLGPYIGKPGTRASAFDRQDFYSNNIGDSFATYNIFTGQAFYKDWTTTFSLWINKQ